MFQKQAPQEEEKQPQDVFSPSNDTVETVVGPSMNVEGDFASEGNIIIKGAVSGSVHTSQLVRLEQGARISANVKAGSAVVSGHVKGNIRVADKLEVTSSAQIQGDITCNTLGVEPGALIQGKINMKGINLDVPGKVERKRPALRSRTKKEDEVSE